MKICFASNNAHKLKEIQQLLGPPFEVISLEALGCTEELAEDQDTLEGNARQKAAYVWEKYQVLCFADDTGLEVEALNQEPGVYSARYAGPARDNQANMQKVLDGLQGKENRKARFRTSIALILEEGETHFFDGIVEGHITQAPRGDQGFGYDPIFVPEGHDRTFAQMDSQEKNQISHRGRAVQQLVSFLQHRYVQTGT
ncbi:non-canonical purine NTP diphosphatase [Rufibacter glacialis]|uniref:dITP/XTP pyrophosphatase n=1 Tax=Rufibacter glacialis TaxID=1259555 RepID=A0A5M8QQI6_9BACT|nr:non-canonical purine NTP diphosphatase [Rufibacter glacialis]KAA6437538.1 non-canonical purine NTP diphosphatase [Rufibacter glacialis]GGK58487.1 non-canonical purine NTP pyrophosphatase [Rufibacter glacialis]